MYKYLLLLPRRARITVILSFVPITLLLLRNNLIPLHQSSNFVWSLSNHPGFGTMLHGISAYMFLLVAASSVDISVFICLSLLEASSVIFKDPSLSDNALISFVLLELILVHLCSLHYMYFISWQVTLSSIILYTPLLQGELIDALPNVTIEHNFLSVERRYTCSPTPVMRRSVTDLSVLSSSFFSPSVLRKRLVDAVAPGLQWIQRYNRSISIW